MPTQKVYLAIEIWRGLLNLVEGFASAKERDARLDECVQEASFENFAQYLTTIQEEGTEGMDSDYYAEDIQIGP